MATSLTGQLTPHIPFCRVERAGRRPTAAERAALSQYLAARRGRMRRRQCQLSALPEHGGGPAGSNGAVTGAGGSPAGSEGLELGTAAAHPSPAGSARGAGAALLVLIPHGPVLLLLQLHHTIAHNSSPV